MVKDVNAVVHTTEKLLAWTHRKYRDISQTVHALFGVRWQRTVHDEAALGVVWIYEEVVFWETANIDCWQAWSIFMNLVILWQRIRITLKDAVVCYLLTSMIWIRSKALSQGITGIPI